MRIRFYGTRGSVPVSRPGTRKYGGNTTCLRILSDCLPPDTALLIDAGSGFVEASRDLLALGIRRIVLLMTHYHHDHTLGFPVAQATFDRSIQFEVSGPRENGIGPREVFEGLMRPPCFPVSFSHVQDHFQFHGMEAMESLVLLVHREAGVAWKQAHGIGDESDPRSAVIAGIRVPLADCLRIRVARTVHPDCTVSYRIEEGPSDRVAVFLTDHEASEEIAPSLRSHLQGVHLLIQDAQYTQHQWEGSHAGYGHGTGAFAARVIRASGALRMGLTHHDPEADDDQVDAIAEEARRTLQQMGSGDLADRVFSARDYQEEEV